MGEKNESQNAGKGGHKIAREMSEVLQQTSDALNALLNSDEELNMDDATEVVLSVPPVAVPVAQLVVPTPAPTRRRPRVVAVRTETPVPTPVPTPAPTQSVVEQNDQTTTLRTAHYNSILSELEKLRKFKSEADSKEKKKADQRKARRDARKTGGGAAEGGEGGGGRRKPRATALTEEDVRRIAREEALRPAPAPTEESESEEEEED